MSDKIYAGVDNGVSGSISLLFPDGTSFYAPTPVIETFNYTKTSQKLKRLDGILFSKIFTDNLKERSCIVLMERPMLNPMRWKASISAARCMEAQLIVLELLKLPYMWIDSKQWQREMLPAGLEKQELKKASLDIGRRLFPMHKLVGDADALLMAEWARRKNL